jgi:L-threonylcarbamoyladenylate synthase
MLVKLTEYNRDDLIAHAVSLLEHGGIIGYPTETYYGLGAKYDDPDALRRVFELKKRPDEKALALVIGRMEQLSLLTESVDGLVRRLIDQHWPGPLTLLFEARDGLPSLLVFDRKVAVRMPGPSFALSLAMACPFPMTATSANLSGSPPACATWQVIECFGDTIDLIIDGGETPGGPPSTIVDATGGAIRVVREGAARVT